VLAETHARRVGSVASGLADGLAREGRVILGGDLAFTLSLREASDAEPDTRGARADFRFAPLFPTFGSAFSFGRGRTCLGLDFRPCPCFR